MKKISTGTGRRVYELPPDILDRVRSYQDEKGIASEVETVRRLIAIAFWNMDTVATIEAQLAVEFGRLKDVRLAAAAVLATHPRVMDMQFGKDSVEFTMDGGATGFFTRPTDHVEA